ncbi:hypothetical protein [Megasphaera sueciensis]|uniref:hypothetical protein n=1 Tax=Megasphaera sueciensis TaxID=349094 RepID=UPI003D058F0D
MGVENVIEWIQSAYPNDSWKLDSHNGDDFGDMLGRSFAKYTDEEILNAVEKVIDNVQELPSVATIKKYADNARRANRVPYYQELPFTRQKVDMRQVEKARSQVFSKEKTYSPVITPELRNFAKAHFHDITDTLIAKNYCELIANMETDCMENGYPTTMWMNKKTGCIDTRVVIPWNIRKSKSSFDKFGKEE